jgi:aryl carrier-like protein
VILPDARDHAIERGHLCVVIATIVINVVAVSLLTFAPWSDWRTGAALNFVDNCLLVGFTVVRRDALLERFRLFGVMVRFTELIADAWLAITRARSIIPSGAAR